MPITGKEIANAANVKAAFKRLFSDTSLGGKLRKNMGLGESGPISVGMGGTGSDDVIGAVRNLFMVDEINDAAKIFNGAESQIRFSMPSRSSGSGSTYKGFSHSFDTESDGQLSVGTYVGSNLSNGENFKANVSGVLKNGKNVNAELQCINRISGGFEPIVSNTTWNPDGSASMFVMFALSRYAYSVTAYQTIKFTVTQNAAVSKSDTVNGGSSWGSGILFSGKSCEIIDSRGVSSHWYVKGDDKTKISRISMTKNGAITVRGNMTIEKQQSGIDSTYAPYVLQNGNMLIASTEIGHFVNYDISKNDNFQQSPISIPTYGGIKPAFSFSKRKNNAVLVIVGDDVEIAELANPITVHPIKYDILFASEKLEGLNNAELATLRDGTDVLIVKGELNNAVIVGNTAFRRSLPTVASVNLPSFSGKWLSFRKFHNNKYFHVQYNEEYSHNNSLCREVIYGA